MSCAHGVITSHLPPSPSRVACPLWQLLSEKNKKARTAGSSGSTNGLASSLAFTPVQGIELVNPSQRNDSKEGTETYFSKQAAILGSGA